MSSIERREATRSYPRGAWVARWRTPDGKSRKRTFERKVDAQRHIDRVTASLVTGQYVDPRAGRATFRVYADAWLAAQVHKPSTAALYEGHLRRNVYPILGDLPLDSILPSTVQAWIKRLSMDDPVTDRVALAPATVTTVYKIVATILRSAVRDRKVAVSPCSGIALPEIESKRVQPMTTEQVELLRDAIRPELRALVVLIAGTGLRSSEALGLTRDRLRLLGKNPSVIVDRQLVTLSGVGGKVSFGSPKTRSSLRTVPLPRVVVAALNEHLAEHEVEADGLVFTLGSEPITRQRIGHAWRPAAAAAGLNEATGTGQHALRHYYASLLIRYGESVKTVQARLGHASATETLDT
ncbi:tyrosine-type recombinase/integrase [Microbacterium testaceum]|uniref:tyrosine-type recombinase/integrase n=1 Tax=Microbacterium testaceum TaxID=2033 RepID=UPI000ACAD4F4|nr:site-specific integrase [Microbacterium testaceum]